MVLLKVHALQKGHNVDSAVTIRMVSDRLETYKGRLAVALESEYKNH